MPWLRLIRMILTEIPRWDILDVELPFSVSGVHHGGVRANAFTPFGDHTPDIIVVCRSQANDNNENNNNNGHNNNNGNNEDKDNNDMDGLDGLT